MFKEEDGEKTSTGEMLVEKLPVFVQSADLEVQERVSYKKMKRIICIFAVFSNQAKLG